MITYVIKQYKTIPQQNFELRKTTPEFPQTLFPQRLPYISTIFPGSALAKKITHRTRNVPHKMAHRKKARAHKCAMMHATFKMVLFIYARIRTCIFVQNRITSIIDGPISQPESKRQRAVFTINN